ncbi:MAG: hypothetical protein A2015_16975 [Spirochaetes bacterium GWF1_31_7]|nr:MAG: hypothetical protein A2Y30_14340 [Spirochaetes bacterium GWE1_32_154]OHD50136.1 MAG: hypothetical protein A2Y29_12385 [Spirochaetes bacterium GWE2_31_10]OHD52450.1 MAG: hypothetical protein A2015_16975 [Spirochaetes bacterium GWF1_31_7]HBD96095.1 hypothetical protein [Spirochaetia bacterium]HBI38606.1 hypothetical protein [Spirochaetia bacterium]
MKINMMKILFILTIILSMMSCNISSELPELGDITIKFINCTIKGKPVEGSATIAGAFAPAYGVEWIDCLDDERFKMTFKSGTAEFIVKEWPIANELQFQVMGGFPAGWDPKLDNLHSYENTRYNFKNPDDLFNLNGGDYLLFDGNQPYVKGAAEAGYYGQIQRKAKNDPPEWVK